MVPFEFSYLTILQPFNNVGHYLYFETLVPWILQHPLSCCSIKTSGASFYISILDPSSFACACFNPLALYFGKFHTYRKAEAEKYKQVYQLLTFCCFTISIHTGIPVFFQKSLKILANFMAFNPKILQHVSSQNKDILQEANSQMKFNRQKVY